MAALHRALVLARADAASQDVGYPLGQPLIASQRLVGRHTELALSVAQAWAFELEFGFADADLTPLAGVPVNIADMALGVFGACHLLGAQSTSSCSGDCAA